MITMLVIALVVVFAWAVYALWNAPEDPFDIED